MTYAETEVHAWVASPQSLHGVPDNVAALETKARLPAVPSRRHGEHLDQQTKLQCTRTRRSLPEVVERRAERGPKDTEQGTTEVH